MNTQSWSLAQADTSKKFESLMRGDFAQLKFITTEKPGVSEDLWTEVIGPTNNRDEYWAVLDDQPELITDMPLDYQPIFKPCHVVDFIAQDLDGLALVDLWGKRWGWYKRSDESDYPIQCSLTAPRDSRHLGVLGDGCFRGNKPIRHEYRGISFKNNNEPRFDKARKSTSERNQKVLWVHYAAIATLKEKVTALGITVYEYFPTLRAAQEEIWAVLKRDSEVPDE